MIQTILLITCLACISCTIICIFYRKTNKIEFSFKEGMDKIGLPIISLNQNGNTYNFLLDTGAEFSVLNTTTIENIAYTEIQATGEIYGVSGEKTSTSYVAAGFSYKNTSFLEMFQVCNVAGLDFINEEYKIVIVGILGSSFLSKYKFLVDFKQLKAYTDGKDIKLKTH